MEKLKSATNKSSISSLRFQSKSDFDKFLKFIKKETKELKEIQTPKDSNLKKFLKVGAVGLGVLGIIGLISGFGGRGQGLDDDDEVGGGIGDYAVGRSNERGKPFRPPAGSLIKGGTKGIKYQTRGVNTNKNVQVTQSKTVKVPKTTVNRRGRVITKEFGEVKSTVREKVTSGEIGESPRKKIRERMDIKPREFNNLESDKKITKKITSRGSKIFTRNIAPKAFDIKDPNFIKDMDLVQQELNKLPENKTGGKTPQQLENLLKGMDDVDFDIEKKVLDIQQDPGLKKLDAIDAAQNRLLDAVNKVDTDKTIKSVDNFTYKSKPSSLIRDNLMLSDNPFKKGIGAKFFDRLAKMFGRNPKITRDTLGGINLKGPQFSKLASGINHPIVKVVAVGLDLYAAFQSGKSIINTKDNILTAFYDLYVSFNNAINEGDPSKLMLYKSESSNDNIRTKQILRNQKILQLKEQAESEGGDNNIIVVPTDEGGKQTNLIDNTPTKKGGDKISFVPYEPVNIGEDILLYNLNE